MKKSKEKKKKTQQGIKYDEEQGEKEEKT